MAESLDQPVGVKLDKPKFKKLIRDLASKLNDKETRELAYLQDQGKDCTDALELFTRLEKSGLIGKDNFCVLVEALENIQRNDLAEMVRETAKTVEPGESL